MKNNIVLLSLNKNYSRKIGKKLADLLELFFVDINDILEYNLVNQQMLEDAGKTYFEKEKQKVINSFKDYENSVFCASFELLAQNNTIDVLKQNSIAIYLRLDKNNIENMQKNDDIQHILLAFEEEDQFCKLKADITVNVNFNEKDSIGQIKQGLLNFIK